MLGRLRGLVETDEMDCQNDLGELTECMEQVSNALDLMAGEAAAQTRSSESRSEQVNILLQLRQELAKADSHLAQFYAGMYNSAKAPQEQVPCSNFQSPTQRHQKTPTPRPRDTSSDRYVPFSKTSSSKSPSSTRSHDYPALRLKLFDPQQPLYPGSTFQLQIDLPPSVLSAARSPPFLELRFSGESHHPSTGTVHCFYQKDRVVDLSNYEGPSFLLVDQLPTRCDCATKEKECCQSGLPPSYGIDAEGDRTTWCVEACWGDEGNPTRLELEVRTAPQLLRRFLKLEGRMESPGDRFRGVWKGLGVKGALVRALHFALFLDEVLTFSASPKQVKCSLSSGTESDPYLYVNYSISLHSLTAPLTSTALSQLSGAPFKCRVLKRFEGSDSALPTPILDPDEAYFREKVYSTSNRELMLQRCWRFDSRKLKELLGGTQASWRKQWRQDPKRQFWDEPFLSAAGFGRQVSAQSCLVE